MELYILVVGTFADGFTFYGPFESFEQADLASQHFNQISWIDELFTTTQNNINLVDLK